MAQITSVSEPTAGAPTGRGGSRAAVVTVPGSRDGPEQSMELLAASCPDAHSQMSTTYPSDARRTHASARR